jgi:hypothetical protein
MKPKPFVRTWSSRFLIKHNTFDAHQAQSHCDKLLTVSEKGWHRTVITSWHNRQFEHAPDVLPLINWLSHVVSHEAFVKGRHADIGVSVGVQVWMADQSDVALLHMLHTPLLYRFMSPAMCVADWFPVFVKKQPPVWRVKE